MKKAFCNIKHHQIYCLVLLSLISCEIVDNDPQKHVSQEKDSTSVALEEVAQILSAIPFRTAQVQEVHDAVSSSSGNGYDEEYTMKNLFSSPGAGVGDDEHTRSEEIYSQPLRDLITEHVHSSMTRSDMDPEAFLDALENSGLQIYWPFSEQWNGKDMPIVTFDPEDESEVNVAYEICIDDDGFRHVQEVLVDEEMAKERPVWVINRNSDAGYTSLEMLRRKDPDWGEGGGSIIVSPSVGTKTRADEPLKMLLLKELTVKRQLDPWFAGAAEIFCKIASLDDFTASTEAELLLYNPEVTDFMIVVKRSQVGIPQASNVVLVSEMKENQEEYAFMMTEDDGGTRTEWSCKAKVFVAGKSYGVEISFPFNTRDDILWRGKLGRKSLDRFNNVPSPFGDVELTFEQMEY